jgi:hypothetical protein
MAWKTLSGTARTFDVRTDQLECVATYVRDIHEYAEDMQTRFRNAGTVALFGIVESTGTENSDLEVGIIGPALQYSETWAEGLFPLYLHIRAKNAFYETIATEDPRLPILVARICTHLALIEYGLNTVLTNALEVTVPTDAERARRYLEGITAIQRACADLIGTSI